MRKNRGGGGREQHGQLRAVDMRSRRPQDRRNKDEMACLYVCLYEYTSTGHACFDVPLCICVRRAVIITFVVLRGAEEVKDGLSG
jgi:hypothetical protein